MVTRNAFVQYALICDVLEPRQYLANPGIVDFSVSATETYAGQTITLTAHATDDLGVRAVVFWIEDGQDGLEQFIANSFDQPLGDVFLPDSGTTDRYSIQVKVGASWKATTKFGVDVIDSDGNWSQAPIQFVTTTIRPKPFVLGMRAESLVGGNIRLTAATSTNGEAVTSAGIGGVTFFLDQNGNNQWDSGSDIDLGTGLMIANGIYELTVTPQMGWNTTWFTASAFDTRSGSDRFGPNHTTVLRGDDTAPLITSFDIIPPDNDTHSQVYTSNETLRFYTQYSASSGVIGATVFHDKNRNGLWDAGIDAPLLNRFVSGNPTSGYFDLFQPLGALGHGWQSVGIVVHDNSGRGNDSWSAVTTLWVNIDNTPWVTGAVVSPAPVPLGTASITLTFRVHDDDGVMGVRSSFIDVDHDGGPSAEPGDPLGTGLMILESNRRNGLWRLTFATSGLSAGTYNIHLWLQDYRGVAGPRSIVSFTIV